MKQVDIQALSESFEQNYNTNVKNIHILKSAHVFLLETESERFIIKMFSKPEELKWQDKCVEQLIVKGTKGLVPFIKNKDNVSVNVLDETKEAFYGVMPFIPGEMLAIHNWNHIKNSIRLLAHVHHNGSGIYGKEQIIPFKSKLYEKWSTRYKTFTSSIVQLEKETVREDGLYKLIKPCLEEAIEWGEWSLNSFPTSYVLYLEEQAQWERQIAHQDVAPHNFIIWEHYHYYLIDYDLVDYSPPFFDLIQFLNRILPTYEWSMEALNQLLHEYQKNNPLTQHQIKMLPILIVFPNDFYREWLGLWRQKIRYHPEKIIEYFEFMKETWHYRRKFVHQCMTMVK